MLYDKWQTVTQDVNIYDIFGYCYKTDDEFAHSSLKPYHWDTRKELAVVGGQPKAHKKFFTADEYTPWVRKNRTQDVGVVPPCIYGGPIIAYFNREDVRAALHIPDHVQAWDMCSDMISYTSAERGSQYVYEKLIGKYKILKFSGDVDGAVPTAGTLAWIDSLKLNVVQEWRPYFVKKEGEK